MFDLFIYCLYQPYKHFIFKQEFKKDIFVRIFKFSNLVSLISNNLNKQTLVVLIRDVRARKLAHNFLILRLRCSS